MIYGVKETGWNSQCIATHHPLMLPPCPCMISIVFILVLFIYIFIYFTFAKSSFLTVPSLCRTNEQELDFLSHTKHLFSISSLLTDVLELIMVIGSEKKRERVHCIS